MNKIKETLLQDFKRSNKARKQKLAEKYGFKTVEEYLHYLTVETQIDTITSVKIEEKPTIHNIILLDATGSMQGSKYSNSMLGIQKELEWIKTQTDINYTFTVIEFIEKRYKEIRYNIHGEFMDPKKFELNFCGANGGNTPLYKATLDVIEEAKNYCKPTDKILLKVYTDGGNNEMNEYRIPCLKLIADVQKENFTVTFVGTKNDLNNIMKALDLEESNCLAVDNTGEGFKEAFAKSLNATEVYSKKVIKGEDVSIGFYKSIIK